MQINTADLGYGLDDICDCLCALRATDFSHSERYRPNGPWHDVYTLHWALPGAAPDPLYLKLRMDQNLLTIELCSFHRER